ncbi:MAG: P-loop NTPase [Spirochaetota bacterium]
MTHFAEAREAAQKAIIEDLRITSRIERACLIWDIQGRLKLLFKANDGEDTEDIKRYADSVLSQAAEAYWSGQIWIWSRNSSNPEIEVYKQAWENATLISSPPDIKILDRHFSKSSWFSPVRDEPWPLNEKTPPILSFYSFKGGVGRTTALVSLAIQLSRNGKRVAILDLDLEAPGLASIMPGVEGQVSDYGVVDYLLERMIINPANIVLEEYYYLVGDPNIVAEGPPIVVVPAGQIDEYYLEKLARIDYEALYTYQIQGDPAPSPLGELLKHVRRSRDIDYFLLDSRAGLHDLGGLSLSGISHLDVVFGLDSDQSWRGLEVVVRFLGKDRIKSNQPKQLDCAIVLSMAPTPGNDREVARTRFLEQSYNVFSYNYYSEEEDGEAWVLPAMDTEGQPHYPIVLGFDPQIQRYDQVADIADRLTEGDFKTFAESILERVGRAFA